MVGGMPASLAASTARSDGLTMAVSVLGDNLPMATRERSRWGLFVGLGMLLCGLGMLGWVAWQFWGTNWTSHRKQHEAVQALERAWQQGKSSATDDQGTVRAIVRIPRFGDDYAIPIFAGTSEEALAAGFGHFTDSAGPGQVGNFALAGHRITHGEPLREMPSLEPGDTLLVDTRDYTYTYRLDTGGAALVVPFTATWVLDTRPVNPDGECNPRGSGHRLLTLTTCSELFHTDNRMVAFGHLVKRQERI